MSELGSEFLLELQGELRAPIEVGQTPHGMRRIYDVIGGRVVGPRIEGRVLPSGGDWVLVGSDGCVRLDVRAAFETDDGVVYCTYGGRLVIPPELLPQMANREDAGKIDPSKYYFRTAPVFETASKKYGWLNRIVSVGVGRITPTGVAYRVYEIK